MTTVTFKLTDDMERFLEEEAARLGLQGVEQVILHELTRCQKRERARRELMALIQEGLDTPTVEFTEEMWAQEEKRFWERHPEADAS